MLHRIYSSRRNDEAVMAGGGEGRDTVLPNLSPGVLMAKRDALQARFADLAQDASRLLSAGGTVDEVLSARFEAIRSELAVIERDLAAVADSAA